MTTYLVSQRAEIPQKDDSFLTPRGIMSKLLTNNQVRVIWDIIIFCCEIGCKFHSIVKICVINLLEHFTLGLQVDLKIRIRLMKIIMGVSKVSKCLYDLYLKWKNRAYPLVLPLLMLAPCTHLFQIAPAMGPGMVQRAKEFLLSSPLHKALMTCINPPPAEGYNIPINPNYDRPSPTDVALYVELARDLLASAIQM